MMMMAYLSLGPAISELNIILIYPYCYLWILDRKSDWSVTMASLIILILISP